MNGAFRKKLGAVREFRAFYRKDGTQILLFPQQEPNVFFSKVGGVAKNTQLSELLNGLGFRFPLRYDFQWEEDSHVWVGTCQEMTAPSECPPKKASGRRGRSA